MPAKAHTICLSTFTSSNPKGVKVWQPMLDGMPLSAELTDQVLARNIAVGAAKSLSRPVVFQTWDGDAGELAAVESL